MMPCLSASWYGVRLGACNALGEMGLPEVAPALERMADDKDNRVRRAAAAALAKLKPAN